MQVDDDEARLRDARHADPDVALPAIGELLESLDQLELVAVRRARSQGMSWESIAQKLGRVRSSVWERYAKGKGVQ